MHRSGLLDELLEPRCTGDWASESPARRGAPSSKRRSTSLRARACPGPMQLRLHLLDWGGGASPTEPRPRARARSESVPRIRSGSTRGRARPRVLPAHARRTPCAPRAHGPDPWRQQRDGDHQFPDTSVFASFGLPPHGGGVAAGVTYSRHRCQRSGIPSSPASSSGSAALWNVRSASIATSCSPGFRVGWLRSAPATD